MVAASLGSDENSVSYVIASSIVLAGDIRSPLIADEDKGNKKPTQLVKKRRHFSISHFSSLFHRRDKASASTAQSGSRICTSVKKVLKNCVKKVKPFYPKLSTNQVSYSTNLHYPTSSDPLHSKKIMSTLAPQRLFFSGNMNCIVCSRPSTGSPSSPSTSPNHPVGIRRTSMEELQSAIQGAIAHCKNSLGMSS